MSLTINKDIEFHGVVGIANKDEFVDSLMPALLERFKTTEIYEMFNEISDNVNIAISTTAKFDEKMTMNNEKLAQLLESLPGFTDKISKNITVLNDQSTKNNESIDEIHSLLNEVTANQISNKDDITMLNMELSNIVEINNESNGIKLLSDKLEEMSTDYYEFKSATIDSFTDIGKITEKLNMIDEFQSKMLTSTVILNATMKDYQDLKPKLINNMKLLNKKIKNSNGEIAKLDKKIKDLDIRISTPINKQILFQKGHSDA